MAGGGRGSWACSLIQSRAYVASYPVTFVRIFYELNLELELDVLFFSKGVRPCAGKGGQSIVIEPRKQTNVD